MSKKDCKRWMPMFQWGMFPMPFIPWKMPENKNNAKVEGEDCKQKENVKSTLKSAWKQKRDRKKTTADNRREQWKRYFDYRIKMQDTFAASLPDDLSGLPPFLQMLPMSPRAFMEQVKEFQILANEHFIEQADSVMDFFLKGQEQFFDLVSAAMDKKEEDASAQTQDSMDPAEENAEAEEEAEETEEKAEVEEKPKAGRKPRAKAAQKTRKKTGTKTGRKSGTRKKAKAEEPEETIVTEVEAEAEEPVQENDVTQAEAVETAQDYDVAEAETEETAQDYDAMQEEDHTPESEAW